MRLGALIIILACANANVLVNVYKDHMFVSEIAKLKTVNIFNSFEQLKQVKNTIVQIIEDSADEELENLVKVNSTWIILENRASKIRQECMELKGIVHNYIYIC